MHDGAVATLGHTEPLLDAELWPALLSAIRGAEHEIILTQLLFDPDFTVHGVRVADELERAAKRGVDARLVVNENAAIPDTYDEVVERFAGTGVEVLRLTMSPNVLHAKILVVDAREAFLIDPPFEAKYVDSSTHAGKGGNGGDLPHHCVSLRLRGPAARSLRALAEGILRASGSAPLRPQETPALHETRHAVELAFTSPRGILAPGETHGILDAYARAIGDAKRLIYIETQYFTSPRIREALSRALQREPRLEVILLLNVHMDVPGYDGWQARRLEELDAFAHPRIGVFSLVGPRAGRGKARPVYLHSKVALVDDAWATVGSANLDSISLHESTEFPVTSEPNVEINAVLREGDLVERLRRRLWGEHLGDEGIWRAAAPDEGWLAHWRGVAARNATALAGATARGSGRLLPYETAIALWREGRTGRRGGAWPTTLRPELA